MNINDDEGLFCLKCGDWAWLCDCYGFYTALEESNGDREHAREVERKNRQAEAENLQAS